MILRKLFFALLLVLPAYANMRAPVIINRPVSALKAENRDKIVVLSEQLRFSCPQTYTGGVDFAFFAAQSCDAQVTYKLRSDAARVYLTFVYSGETAVEWQVGSTLLTSAGQYADKQTSCTQCTQQMQKLKAASQVVDLVQGDTTVTIRYRQALSYQETGHSYFSAGKWTQGFTYELWPISEWNLAPDFFADLEFSIATRDGFLGIGYKDDVMQCATEHDAGNAEVDLKTSKPAMGRRVAAAHLKMQAKPLRLRCWYAAG